MKAKIKLTVGDMVFQPGDTITKKLSAADEAFLLREGYIEQEEAELKASSKSARKPSSISEKVS